MPTATGKGNRRTGRARGSSGRRGQLTWREDNELLERIQLVADLYMEPMTTIHRAVNVWLERRGRPAVSIETVKLDRRRALEMLRDRVATGMEGHLVELQHVLEGAWRDLSRSPVGPARAPLYAVAIRCVEDMAKLDGTWGAIREPQAPDMDESGYGPSPHELLEAGEITQDDYRAWLVVMHRHTSTPGGPQPMGRLTAQALGGEVVAGVTMPLPETPAVAPQRPQEGRIKRGSTGRGTGPPPPSMPDLGDEGPRVIQWEEPEE